MPGTNWKAIFEELREQDRAFFQNHPGLKGENSAAKSQTADQGAAREIAPTGPAPAKPRQDRCAAYPGSVCPDFTNSQRQGLWEKYYGSGSGTVRNLAGPPLPDTWSDGTDVLASNAALDLWIETQLSGDTVPQQVKETIFRQQRSQLEELRRNFWAAYLLSPTEMSREGLRELAERLERSTGNDPVANRVQKILHELLLCVQQRVFALDTEWQQGQKNARDKLELQQEDVLRRLREAQN